MTSLDADLVRLWFERLRDADQPVMPHWGIVPTEQETAALADGQTQIDCAVQDRPAPIPAAILTEVPARLLRRYLHALAAGISGTRQLLGPANVEVGRDLGLPGDADALALVTGLNAAAASLLGEIEAPADRDAGRPYSDPTAAEAARLAGVAAAELVVDGAGLQQVIGSAAAALNGWQIGLPPDPVERNEYRTRALVGIVLSALEQVTRDPEPLGEPASCGALPGQNLGRAFNAEITFSMGLADSEIRSLAADLGEIQAEVVVWPGGQWPRFHLHTDRPGEAVGLLYAYGTPFDLEIANRV